MAPRGDDRFRVFISHKHDDHELAMVVHDTLERLTPTIECFVSGVDIVAGSDWNREIRTKLVQSHLLVLLFTRPAQTWDWCLYETGLFTRAGGDEAAAIVCLYNPSEASPRPLASLQGVPVNEEAVTRFLRALCCETWSVSYDWRKGALAPRVRTQQIDRAAAAIIEAFPEAETRTPTYYPCHRVVLDFRGLEVTDRIPEAAKVVEGPGETSGFTLSLFNLSDGRRSLTWGALLESVDGTDAQWRRQLDRRFICALQEELFTPITATLRAWSHGRRHQRILKPVLYRIVRDPPPRNGGADARGAPIGLTLLFDPQLAPARVAGPAFNLVRINARFGVEVFDEYRGTVRERLRDGEAVFAEIAEALRLVYEEADRYGVFDEEELRAVYGPVYEAEDVGETGLRWDATRAELETALAAGDVEQVEARLTSMSEMNRRFSILSTQRYLSGLSN